MKKLTALVLALCLLLSASLALADTFKMGIDAEYPPFSYLDDSGAYAGFDVEMCKAVCDLLGWEQEIVLLKLSLGYQRINSIWLIWAELIL